MNSKGRSDWLRLFAMVTMLIDHCGILLFPQAEILRKIGRLAFPIFAYGIARGFTHTKSRRKYMLRLFVFGAISQIPYMWLHNGARFDPFTINQLWQFLYTLIALVAVERSQKSETWPMKILYGWIGVFLIFLPDALRYLYPQWKFSYGTYGILMSVLFYVFEGRWPQLIGSYVALSYFYGYISVAALNRSTGVNYFESLGMIEENIRALRRYGRFLSMSGVFRQSLSILALPFIYASQRIPGRPFMNRFTPYLFYPLHIVVLLLIYHIF